MKALFVHIPKSGGTTVFKCSSKIIRIRHFTAWALKQGAYDGDWDKTYTFSFVRNPWDRIVSWYFYHKHKDNRAEFKLYRESTFESWVKDGCPTTWPDNEDPYTMFYGKGRKKTPLIQRTFLTDPNDKMIVDFIGKLENFDSDFAKVRKKLGITNKPKHENKGKHKPYREYYDQEMVTIVEKLCKPDIDTFGYSFGE